ncbi:signal peptidase II [Pseudohongiella sp.]|uniref:Lipoprotein signal peptidase n=1 Tax=marine sediment metagenome TaxID=412755 RepID=A0A0F9VML8_9ZZZZ|nr:signal peptidase II [Pseudohongiella sp.]HDZ10537.1 signal peptidase II [Pseudohongiella sp.]HEA62452.1 signal peptidase II [Pseudohongiella sp.]
MSGNSPLRSFLTAQVADQRAPYLVYFAMISAACLALSQLGSYLVNTHIPLGSSVQISPVLHFTHIRNLGGVFGLAQGQGWIFAVFSVVLIGALVWYLLRGRQVRVYEFLCFGFIAGGGLSNVLDRLLYGSVIDFIDVRGIPFWHYIFNTADTFVHIGLWPMLFIGLLWHRD